MMKNKMYMVDCGRKHWGCVEWEGTQLTFALGRLLRRVTFCVCIGLFGILSCFAIADLSSVLDDIKQGIRIYVIKIYYKHCLRDR